MIQLVVLFPDGQQQEVLLSGVPRTGDRIRLKNGAATGSPQFVVEQVLWVEGAPEPNVILSVRAVAK